MHSIMLTFSYLMSAKYIANGCALTVFEIYLFLHDALFVMKLSMYMFQCLRLLIVKWKESHEVCSSSQRLLVYKVLRSLAMIVIYNTRSTIHYICKYTGRRKYFMI